MVKKQGRQAFVCLVATTFALIDEVCDDAKGRDEHVRAFGNSNGSKIPPSHGHVGDVIRLTVLCFSFFITGARHCKRVLSTVATESQGAHPANTAREIYRERVTICVGVATAVVLARDLPGRNWKTVQLAPPHCPTIGLPELHF